MKKGFILFTFLAVAFLFSGCELAKELISPSTVSEDVTPIDLNFSDGVIIIEAEPSGEEAVEDDALEETADDLEAAEEDLNEMDEESESADETDTTETTEEEVVETELEAAEVDYSGYPNFEFNEGELVSFSSLKAVDPEGNEITYTFATPLNNDGEWQTTIGDAGQYLVTITASDGTLESSQEVVVVINSVNNPPVMELMDDLEVDEGETLTINPVVNDADDDELTITYSGWMTSDTYTTTHDDSGIYLVTITVSDGISEVTEEITIVVNEVNLPPCLCLGDVPDYCADYCV